MESYIADIQTKEARFWKIAERASLIVPFVLGAFFFLKFWPQIHFTGITFIFSLSTFAVALILAGTYFFAYKFFKENFYFFISVSWIANAVYLIPDINGPAFYENGFFKYQSWIILLSLTSSFILLLALFTPSERKPSKATWLIIIAVGIVLTVITYAVITYLPSGNKVEKRWEKVLPKEQWDKASAQANVYLTEQHQSLITLMLLGSLVSFVAISCVGAALTARLSKENTGWKGRFLSDTFYFYAALQFAYTIIQYYVGWNKHWFHFLFLVAQLAKVANALSLVGVVQSAIDSRNLRRDQQIEGEKQEIRIKKAELIAQEEKLQSQRQFVELGMLASSIKHDVNTPLTTMSFDIGSLKEKHQHDKKIIRELEKLEESMERIYAIVKVVDIFRGDKAFFDRDRFMIKASMLEVVHRAVRSVKNEMPALKENNAQNKIKVKGHDVWVRAYAPMLEQVIVNVIKNGLEAIGEAQRAKGYIDIKVGTTTIEESKYSRWVKVEIEDNGIGIPAENLNKLTTLFTTRSDKKPNSGIGLFIGKKILDIHDGKIGFQSTAGEGTKVTVLLPEWNAIQRLERGSTESPLESDAELPDVETPLDEDMETVRVDSELTETDEHSGGNR